MSGPEDPLGVEVRALLRDRIQDFEELEVLMTLFQDPKAGWLLADLVKATRLDESSVERALVELCRRGLVGTHGEASGADRWVLQPDTNETAVAVERLARCFHDSRLDVMKAMSDNAIARVRTKAMRLFADAFVVGGKKDGG